MVDSLSTRRKVYTVRKKGKYFERIVKLPSDFPDVKEVVVLTPEEYEKLGFYKKFKVLKGYYVVHKCGYLAHLVVESIYGEKLYYCPKCNVVFQGI